MKTKLLAIVLASTVVAVLVFVVSGAPSVEAKKPKATVQCNGLAATIVGTEKTGISQMD